VPVTAGGRAVATILMVCDAGFLGLIAASFASFFVGRRQDEEVRPRVDEALERLAHIEALLEARDDPSNASGGPPDESGPPARSA
jgi:NAD/NADP transhydrogenase alpha subunit